MQFIKTCKIYLCSSHYNPNECSYTRLHENVYQQQIEEYKLPFLRADKKSAKREILYLRRYSSRQFNPYPANVENMVSS